MSSDPISSRSEIGDKFEAEIAEIYIAAGYNVTRHVSLDGQEVDILAEKQIPGATPYRVLVECKFKGGTRLVGNEDVQAIAGAYQIARMHHKVSACTLITTNGFSLPAQQAAKKAGILLSTRRDLIRSLLDFRWYHRLLQEEFVQDFGLNGESWYMPAYGRSGPTDDQPLLKMVDQWRVQKDKHPLLILGGYGTGKTSFCRNLAVKLSQSQDEILPLIISLREYQKATKIEKVIRDVLEEKCNISGLQFDAFWRMYKEGMLLLLFDGLDEMAARVDATILELILTDLDKFTKPPANVILTCRPEFFTSQTEELQVLQPSKDPLSSRAAEYERIEMILWRPPQIAEFVQRRVSAIVPPPKESAAYYLERIEALPELYDMSSRPVHLELIVRLLPDMVTGKIPITRTNLYRVYIDREFRRETVENRRLRIISDEDRVKLLRLVAARAILDHREQLDFANAAELVRRLIQPPASEVEHLTRDLLNRSFLNRNDDKYEFAHKSIGEYLFATHVHEQLEMRNPSFVRFFMPTVALAGMVLELFGGVSKFDDLKKSLGIADEQLFSPATGDAFKFATYSILDYLDRLWTVNSEFLGDSAVGTSELLHKMRSLLHKMRSRAGLLTSYLELLDSGKYSDHAKNDIPFKFMRLWVEMQMLVNELQTLEIERNQISGNA